MQSQVIPGQAWLVAFSCLVSLATDHAGRPKGFAFVTFENEQGAEDAVNGANGQVLLTIFIIFSSVSKFNVPLI